MKKQEENEHASHDSPSNMTSQEIIRSKSTQVQVDSNTITCRCHSTASKGCVVR
jgi:hypothetical protein